MSGNVVTLGAVQAKVSKYLEAVVGSTSMSVSSARLVGTDWFVNVLFTLPGSNPTFPESGLFIVDGNSGEVKEFRKGFVYRW
jgi:hypothetical protein